MRYAATVSCDVCWSSVRKLQASSSSTLSPTIGLLRYEYLWEDGVKFKRPTKLPAPEYVDALMNWAQNILDDETVFPNKIGVPVPALHTGQHSFVHSPIGVPFPKNFRDTVRTIFRRLFRVYGHIYSSHFDQICALGIEGLATFLSLVVLSKQCPTLQRT